MVRGITLEGSLFFFSFLNFHFSTQPVPGLLLSKGQFNLRREATFIPRWPLFSFFLALSFSPLSTLLLHSYALFSFYLARNEKK